MASAAVTETLSVQLRGEAHPLAVLSLLDRRRKRSTRKAWVLVRALEKMLYDVAPGGRSTGRRQPQGRASRSSAC